MRLSAVTRKSISDLRRRRARTVLVVAALALAVASVGLFAVPTLMSRAMNREIAANKLADVTLTVKPLPLTAPQLHALASLPNVVAFEPRTTFSTRAYVGARRQKAILIGEPSFEHQTVDAVTVTAGSPPGPGAVASDIQNAAYGRGVGGAGGSVRLIAGDGKVISVPISGQARNLTGAQAVALDGFVTLYGTAPTVAALSGTPGYTRLAFRLRDASRAAAERLVVTVRRTCTRSAGSPGSAISRRSALPETGPERASSIRSPASSPWSRCSPCSAHWSWWPAR